MFHYDKLPLEWFALKVAAMRITPKLQPEATMVSNATPSEPALRMAYSISAAASFSFVPSHMVSLAVCMPTVANPAGFSDQA